MDIFIVIGIIVVYVAGYYMGYTDRKKDVKK